MIKFKILVGALICVSIIAGCAAPVLQPIFPPVSKEANLKSTGEAEVSVSAAGIGVGKKNQLTSNSLLDARRSALYFVLYGGTDPVLQTPAEKSKFENVAEVYFDRNLSKYISWESDKVELRRSIEGGSKLKIKKDFKINKKMLKEDLAMDNIIKPEADEQEDVGMPMLMVIPKVSKNESPVDVMNSNPQLEHAAQAIKSLLSNRVYEFQIPEQASVIDDQVEGQLALKDAEPDLSKQLALAIGSDVYVTYTIDVRTNTVGGQTVRKAIVSVEAFETTTARSLGTETGYSEERASEDKVVIEEAVTQAFDKVLSRVNAYWKKDAKKGIQYRVIFQIEGDFDEDARQDIRFALYDVVKEISNQSKELVATDMTSEYLIWAKIDQFEQSRDVVRALMRGFPSYFRGGKISEVFAKGKLVILKVRER